MSYADSADLYDLVYAEKDYAREAERLRQLIAERSPAAATLLDVACGTGRHLEHLSAWYDVAGLDAEPRLLDVARARLPGTPLHSGDMRTFVLDRRFDVVTCLFSAIGYMHTRRELGEAVNSMARHLTPGGLLIVEPWLSPDSFDSRHMPEPTIGSTSDVTVVRMNGSRVEGRLSVIDFNYLVARPGTVEHFLEIHALALYSEDEYRAAFVAAGLEVEYDVEGLMGRGLWIGRSPEPV